MPKLSKGHNSRKKNQIFFFFFQKLFRSSVLIIPNQAAMCQGNSFRDSLRTRLKYQKFSEVNTQSAYIYRAAVGILAAYRHHCLSAAGWCPHCSGHCRYFSGISASRPISGRMASRCAGHCRHFSGISASQSVSGRVASRCADYCRHFSGLSASRSVSGGMASR